MNLTRIINKVYSQPWAILPESHEAIQKLIEAKIAGSELAPFLDPVAANPVTITGSVAVLDVCGVILPKANNLETMCGAFSLATFRKNLKAVAANPAVKSIVLNFDTPGGIITGVPEAADLIAEVAKTKEVIAYTSTDCASAGYWLASQAGTFLASKSAAVGSIGVYLALLDITKAMENEGVKLELFKAGAFKAMGMAGKTLSDDERALLQKGVDDAYAQFTGYVLSKRQLSTETMQGQMFVATEAVSNGLIDGVQNSLDDLIDYIDNRNASLTSPL